MSHNMLNIIEGHKENSQILECISAKGDIDLEAKTICEILKLQTLPLNAQLEMIRVAIDNQTVNQQLFEYFFQLCLEQPMKMKLCLDQLKSVVESVCRFSNKLGKNRIRYFADAIESLNARGIDLKTEMVCLLRLLDSNIPSEQYESNILLVKMALVVYESNLFNYKDKGEQLDKLALIIKANKLKSMKGALHYYYAQFKKRHPQCSFCNYGEKSYDEHMWKAEKANFWLTNIEGRYAK